MKINISWFCIVGIWVVENSLLSILHCLFSSLNTCKTLSLIKLQRQSNYEIEKNEKYENTMLYF